MKKVFIFTFFLLFTVALIGCQQSSPAYSQQENDKSPGETVSIYEMEGFQKVKKGSFLAVIDPEVIEIVAKTINTADKVPGIVNVMVPEYKIVIRGEAYLLWSREESATVMNAEDTNTVYTVQPERAKQVHEFLKTAEFTSEAEPE